MQIIAINIPAVSVSLSRGFTRLRCVNMAERIEVLLGVETIGDLRNTVLNGSPNFSHGFDAAFAQLLWPLVTTDVSVLESVSHCWKKCFCWVTGPPLAGRDCESAHCYDRSINPVDAINNAVSSGVPTTLSRLGDRWLGTGRPLSYVDVESTFMGPTCRIVKTHSSLCRVG